MKKGTMSADIMWFIVLLIIVIVIVVLFYFYGYNLIKQIIQQRLLGQ